MEKKMKRQLLISSLVAGAALTLLGGCASYDDYGSGYYGGTYYNNGYYGSDYDSPVYYGGTYYGPGYIPRGGYGGGYNRNRHDNDHRDVRPGDGEHRDFRRGDNDGSRGDGNRSFSRNQPQQNTQPAQQQAPSSGWRGGRDGGSQSGGFQSGGSRSSDSGGSQSGDRPSGGPSGRFGHPGTPNNPL
jgi:hypothetical protein